MARVLAGIDGGSSTVTSEGSIVWQLVSANNRQLARGIDVYESFEEAHSTASDLVEASASLTVSLVSEAGRGAYGWYLSSEGRPVITCARWYLTERDRRNSITLAIRSLAVATLSPGTRLSDSTLMADDRGSLV
ncbi:hypothetical protein [Pseudolysinimonas sp.]|uniref:hypothetical protein n=1 Tax=Pseudolysinimonas sp. TaxID=2680009 RepID=UPI00286C3932|nr:hypothetical protein [Pseudolysinimonas sp.]